MESEKELQEAFFEHIDKIRYFNKLKEVEGKENQFTVDVKVSGFTELNLMVCDILKVCVLALEGEPPYVSSLILNPEINVLGLLELALQLMPDELELLDELHQAHLKIQKMKIESAVS